MEPLIPDIGSITKQKEGESSFMLMEINMKANGRMIKPTDMEYTSISKQVRSTKAIGKTICSMVQV